MTERSNKFEVPIQEVYEAVHEAKKRGVDISTTLKKYGIKKAMFYYKANRAGLKTWRSKRRGLIATTRPIKPTKEKQKPISDTEEPLTVIPTQKSGRSKGGNMLDPKKQHSKKEAVKKGDLTDLEDFIYKR